MYNRGGGSIQVGCWADSSECYRLVFVMVEDEEETSRERAKGEVKRHRVLKLIASQVPL